jgi:hypothetical protein
MEKNKNIPDNISSWKQNPIHSFSRPKYQVDKSIVYEMAVISCLIKNKRLTSSNIDAEIEDIKSKSYFG